MAEIEIASERTASASYDKLVDVTMRLDESNKLAAEAIISSKETSAEAKETAQKTIDAIKTGHSDGSEKPHGDTTKHHSFLEGHFGWMKKEAERASKLAKLGLGKVSDFGKAAASKVEHFAKMAKEMEVGIVCSGHEAKAVRKIIGPDLQIFSPGIRMPDDSSNDQQRVCTPLESIKNGSNKIIMGRSLIKGNIIENINKVSESLKI